MAFHTIKIIFDVVANASAALPWASILASILHKNHSKPAKKPVKLPSIVADIVKTVKEVSEGISLVHRVKVGIPGENIPREIVVMSDETYRELLAASGYRPGPK